MRVLVVEDNPGDTDLIVEYLSEAYGSDLQWVPARYLSDALPHLGDSRFDAVLLDLYLPDSQGLETIDRIYERDPDVAIVVLTGAPRDRGRTAIGKGAQDFIEKSRLSADGLSNALNHAVERARNQTRMRAVVEKTADGIVVVTRDGLVGYVNPAAEALFGTSSVELEGRPFEFPTDEPGPNEVEIAAENGAGWAELRVTSFEWQGEPARLVSLRDITDRKRAEELQERLVHADRLAAVGRLAAGVAHEVNNPATYILSNLGDIDEFLSDLRVKVERSKGNDSSLVSSAELAEMSMLLAESQEGIERIVRIVRDLTSFARSSRAHLEELEINTVIRAACKMAQREIQYRARLVIDLNPVPKVVGDRGKLGQVFTNLLLNAAQAIDEGDPDNNVVRVHSHATPDAVVVVVEDSGRGMTAEVKRRAFEPFFTTKPRGVGTGLGLSVSAEIIRKHGGLVQIDSEAGTGTQFRLTLPFDSAFAQEVRRGDPARESVIPGRGRVMVIDDEPAVLNAVQKVLSRSHVVTAFEDSRHALEHLKGDVDFDAIVCDVMMPHCDAKEVYEQVAKRDSALADRMVFYTGGTFSSRLKEFVESVPNPCLEKPLEWKELKKLIERLRRERWTPEH